MARLVLTEPTIRRDDPPFDLRGSFLFSTFILVMLAGFCLIPIQGISILYLQALSLIAAVSGGLFLFHSERNRSTVLDTGLIRNRNFSFALISFFVIMLLHAGNNFLFPLYLMQHKHIDPSDAGLILMASAILPLVAAPSAGRLADLHGCRPICLAATLLIIAFSLAFYMLSACADVLPMVISFYLFRGAIASFLGSSRKLILGHCPMESKGSGSGLMMMSSYSGLALGVAFFEIVFIEAVISGGLVHDGTSIMPRLTPSLSLLGYSVTFLFEAAAAALALVFVYLAQDPIAGMPAQKKPLRGMVP